MFQLWMYKRVDTMTLLSFGLVILSAILVADVKAQCEDSWEYFQEENKCIRILYGIIGSRGSAMRACGSVNARLLTIHNQGTQTFIEDLIQDRTRFFWIGLNDWNKEGTFVWPDGKPMSSYQNWNPGQPDDHSGSEDCVHLTKDLRWNDFSCSAGGHGFICEKIGPGCTYKNGGCPYDCSDADDSGWKVTCSKKCDAGYALFNGTCYDIDECSLNNGGCDKECKNTRGSFECECQIDYIWDGSMCVLPNHTLIG